MFASFTSMRPLFAVSEAPEIVEGLTIAEIGTYFAPSAAPTAASSVAETFRHAKRVLFPSSVAFHAAAAELGRYPTNVAVYRTRDEPSEISARTLMEFAGRDLGLEKAVVRPEVQKVLDRLTDVPVDIQPKFTILR